jgi:hypothetical protein
MSSIGITLVKFAFVFGVALLGMALRAVLPQNDVTADSRDVVKLGMGLVEMMAALVLGLLIASAKSSFDMQSVERTEMSSRSSFLTAFLPLRA